MTTWIVLAVALAACGKSDTGTKPGDKPTVEAFQDYKHKAMATEGSLELNKISKEAKYVVAEKSGFPIGKALLTPATECCKSADHKCAPDPKSWAAEPWTTLGFTIDDPHRFRYSYESIDGTSFTATAVADLDCNGTLTTMTATGTLDASGSPHTEIK
ncbi:hypothetical protein BH11MYX1_BH11MYX1_16160 [soil metagenome]